MRKIIRLMAFAATMLLASPAGAQDSQIFNHLSIGAEVGTTGWGFEAAVPLTHFVTFRTGFTTLPRFDVKFDINYTTKGQEKNVDVRGRVHMTDFKLLADIYPFKHSSFHLTGGFYAGLPDLGTVHNTGLVDVDEGEGLEIGVGNHMLREFGYTLRDVDVPEFVAPAKGCITNGNDTFGDMYGLQVATEEKTIAAQFSERVGKIYLRQVLAIIKCMFSDIVYTLADGYLLKVYTIGKCVIPDALKA